MGKLYSFFVRYNNGTILYKKASVCMYFSLINMLFFSWLRCCWKAARYQLPG